MEFNKVNHLDFLANSLPDKCANLIIADPPYFEVKGNFDFVYKTFAQYLAYVESWAQECKRLLADNGTLYWWGHAKKIAYNQIILDKYFTLLNNAVWVKNDCQTKRNNYEAMRCFAPLTERCLLYGNEKDDSFWQNTAGQKDNFLPIKQYLRDEKLKSKKSLKWFIDCTSSAAGHYFIDSQWLMPTEKDYKFFQKETNFFQKPYETLRQQYETLRRPFIQNELQTDIWNFGQQANITKNYSHPTQKPPKLCDMIINTSSRADDLVVVPFAGSGSECAAAAKYGRRFMGFDINANYCKISNDRINEVLNSPELF